MKSFFNNIACLVVFGFISSLSYAHSNDTEAKVDSPQSLNESVALGASLANRVLQDSSYKWDLDDVAKGFTEVLSGELKVNLEQIKSALTKAENFKRKSFDDKVNALYKANIEIQKEKQKMLEADKALIKLDGGVFYKFVKNKNGKVKVNSSSIVKVEAKISDLENNVAFNSDKAIISNLEDLPAAWKIFLPLMSDGDVVLAYVPSELGFGFEGLGDRIEPGEMHILELHLIEVLK